jgi:hypothetical protein
VKILHENRRVMNSHHVNHYRVMNTLLREVLMNKNENQSEVQMNVSVSQNVSP